MTNIFYNGINPFSGIAPTPYVRRSVNMVDVNGRWCQAHTFDLEGTITGKCSTFEDLTTKQRNLISGFSKDFQTLEFFDDGSGVFSEPLVKVKEISFDSSNYAYNIPFKIKLESYPQEYFSGDYGVIEPTNEIKFDESKDGVITITQSVSARGLNTNSSNCNAVDNARIWAQNQTGISNVFPHFISYSNYSPELVEESESIDRLNGKYEIQLTFSTDKYLVGKGVLRYSSDYSYDIDAGISTVQVQGSIVGSKVSNISDLRSRYQGFNAFSEANNFFYKIAGRTDLQSVPLTKSVSEDTTSVRLSFSSSYSDSAAPVVVFETKTSFDYNYETDSVSAKIDGQIKTIGVFENRWAVVKQVADQTNLYSLILPYYSLYLQNLGLSLADYPLNSTPSSKSRGENQNSAEIRLSATYSNQFVLPSGFRDYQCTINVSPSLQQYSVCPCLDQPNIFTVYDLGYASRSQYDIQINGVGGDSVSQDFVASYLKNATQNIRASYVGGSEVNLDSQEIEKSNASFDKTVSIRSSFSSRENAFQL